jgi:hypothetical protein
MREFKPVTAFRASNYQYRLKLGTVSGTDCYSIHHTVECQSFKEVVMIAELWRKDRENPVFEVDTVYLPDKIKPGEREDR